MQVDCTRAQFEALVARYVPDGFSAQNTVFSLKEDDTVDTATFSLPEAGVVYKFIGTYSHADFTAFLATFGTSLGLLFEVKKIIG